MPGAADASALVTRAIAPSAGREPGKRTQEEKQGQTDLQFFQTCCIQVTYILMGMTHNEVTVSHHIEKSSRCHETCHLTGQGVAQLLDGIVPLEDKPQRGAVKGLDECPSNIHNTN